MIKKIRVKSGIDILVGKMVNYDPYKEHSDGDVIINVQKNSFNYGATMIDKDSRFSDKVNWKKVNLETVEIKPTTGVKRMIAKIKKLQSKHREFCIGEKDITFSAIGNNDDGEATIINWKVCNLDTDEIHVEAVSIAKGTLDSYYDVIDYEDLDFETIDSILDTLDQYDVECDKFTSNQYYANI